MSRISRQIDAYLDQVAEAQRQEGHGWVGGPKRPEQVLEEDGYLTVVWYVGSPWNTSRHPVDHGIAHLLWMLTEYALDPTFEEYGNFVQRDPQWLANVPWRPPGMASIGGNFYAYSCAFGLETNHPELIDLLEQAVGANKARPDYVQAAGERREAKDAAAAVKAEEDRVAQVQAEEAAAVEGFVTDRRSRLFQP